MLVFFLPIKSRKRLAHDIFDIFATDAGFLFMVLLIQTTGYKMAALMLSFHDCQTLTFKQIGPEI